MKSRLGKHWSRHNEQHGSAGLLQKIHQAKDIAALERLEVASFTTFPNASAKTKRRWTLAIDVARKKLTTST